MARGSLPRAGVERLQDTQPILPQAWLVPLDEVGRPAAPDTVELPRGRSRGTPAQLPPPAVALDAELPRAALTPSARLALLVRDPQAWPVAGLVAAGVVLLIVVSALAP